MNVIGTVFSDAHSDGEYWDGNESFTNVLPGVTVSTPAKPATSAKNNTWLWVAGAGIAALFLFGKK